MKTGEQFRLDSGWWKRNRATTLLPTGLTRALTRYEAVRTKVSSLHGESHPLDACDIFDDAVAALAAVDTARRAAITRCTQPPHSETKDALRRDGAIGDARAELAGRCAVPIKARLGVLDTQLATLRTCGDSLRAALEKTDGREPTEEETASIKALFGRLEDLTDTMGTNLGSLPNAARLSRIDTEAGDRRNGLEQGYRKHQSSTMRSAVAPYLAAQARAS